MILNKTNGVGKVTKDFSKYAAFSTSIQQHDYQGGGNGVDNRVKQD